MPGYRHEAELEALKCRAVREALRVKDVRRIAFADL
jgi:hypothetical protein